jgi:amidase
MRHIKTDGSIVCPSSKNNLVGIKPTLGLTSRYLVIPLSEHQDTVGPMARTVKDAAHLLQAIAGIDSRDNYTSMIPNKGKLPNYVATCRSSALEGARIGVPRNVISTLARVATVFELAEFNRAISVLKLGGTIIVDPANFTGIERYRKDLWRVQGSLLAADFLANLPAYTSELKTNPQNITDLASLRKFTRLSPKEGYPDHDTSLWDEALDEQGWNNTDPRFWPAYQEFLQYSREGGLLGALQRDNLDAVILPTILAPAWASGLGTPIVTVPLGFFPANTSVHMDPKGDLVTVAPGIP